MIRMRVWAVILLLAGLAIGYFDYATQAAPFGRFEKIEKFPIRLGLDLSGGTHLVYRADISALPASEVKDSMSALRDVIERRVNLFGVAEPMVQVEGSSFLTQGGAEERLIVELPGLTDTDEAVKMIGATPVLEFKTERPTEERDKILEAQKKMQEAQEKGTTTAVDPLALEDPYYIPTELTGRYLKKATVEFGQQTISGPMVGLQFNDEGGAMFAKITKENVGKTIAIFLDGSPISAPVVQEEITGGTAQITGTFTIDEVKQLVGRLNAGALPVPIELLSAQTIGASLGDEAYQRIIHAGLVGFIVLILFIVIWYRLPGILAAVALSVYVALMLAIFKLIPVTLTSAGIAGFILSIGMAVDANILIFERMKEELKRGRTVYDAVHEGFARAWFSIRDSNSSSLISSVILFWFGTSMIEGFALTLGIGVLVSMFTALTLTRTFLLALGTTSEGKGVKFLFGSGAS